MDHLVVVTGGPGSGKTTLLDHLSGLGFPRTPEAGRAIIRDQREIGGTGLVWKDARLFGELMLQWELRSHREAADRPGPVFCDRGVPDLVGWYLLQGEEVPEHVAEAARRFRYHRTVFVAPPWPEIFGADPERHQSWDEAVRTHAAMVEAYPAYGYKIVELPLAPVAERAAFVLERVHAGH
ncbi:AAA family ATPase [Nocardiopsis xinjiangensis]|uniref:AAA family ATPase n=1 Tax=Nocardiopsis xinjiangensis TaxID=124285 RepID=UPI0003455801|nr:AAA family ATPase [Nocardiopsis xinjiangensis]